MPHGQQLITVDVGLFPQEEQGRHRPASAVYATHDTVLPPMFCLDQERSRLDLSWSRLSTTPLYCPRDVCTIPDSFILTRYVCTLHETSILSARCLHSIHICLQHLYTVQDTSKGTGRLLCYRYVCIVHETSVRSAKTVSTFTIRPDNALMISIIVKYDIMVHDKAVSRVAIYYAHISICFFSVAVKVLLPRSIR